MLVQHKDNVDVLDIRINIVWESVGVNQKKQPWVFAGLGDVCYLRMNISDAKVKSILFRHCVLPPDFPTSTDLLEEHKNSILTSRQSNIGGFPTVYGDCSFNGYTATMARGWFDEPWLSFRGLGMSESGISSIDLTGSWSVGMLKILHPEFFSNI